MKTACQPINNKISELLLNNNKPIYKLKQYLRPSSEDEGSVDELFSSDHSSSSTYQSDIFQCHEYNKTQSGYCGKEIDHLSSHSYSNSESSENECFLHDSENCQKYRDHDENKMKEEELQKDQRPSFDQQTGMGIKEEEDYHQYADQTSQINNDQQSADIISYEAVEKVIKSNNIIKNIIKQYFNYLLRESNSELISEFIVEKPVSYSIKLIKKYFKGITYNNSSLIKILKHEKYGRGLEYYLTFDAIEELQNSKVQNLEEHIQSIQFLKQCCVDHTLLENINFYKKRCKLPQV